MQAEIQTKPKFKVEKRGQYHCLFQVFPDNSTKLLSRNTSELRANRKKSLFITSRAFGDVTPNYIFVG